MNAYLKEFTDVNFVETVINAEQISVVDFWAEWCGPCRSLAPILDDVANQYAEKVNVGKLNVDSSPETASQFGITTIPTILFFKNGEIVDRIKGLVAKKEIELKITALQNNLSY
jgi:thioredoxin 1